MKTVQIYKTPNLTIVNGQVKTTSLAIAELFGKRHDHVLRDIETIKTNCSIEFSERNFAFSTYTHHLPKSGEVEYKCIDMTRDGMTMIIMGYTGIEAMRFKEAYIMAFNKMEAELMSIKRIPKAHKPRITLADSNESRWLRACFNTSGNYKSKDLHQCYSAWCTAEGIPQKDIKTTISLGMFLKSCGFTKFDRRDAKGWRLHGL